MAGDRLRHFKASTARALRARQTAPERHLWKALKCIPIYGTHVRRQAAIGPYVADFVCRRARLVIELDGGHHAEPDIAERDMKRTLWLESQGYRVLRFWNTELNANLDGVLDTIHAALYGSPHAEATPFPTPPRRASRADPPPQGEGG